MKGGSAAEPADPADPAEPVEPGPVKRWARETHTEQARLGMSNESNVPFSSSNPSCFMNLNDFMTF